MQLNFFRPHCVKTDLIFDPIKDEIKLSSLPWPFSMTKIEGKADCLNPVEITFLAGGITVFILSIFLIFHYRNARKIWKLQSELKVNELQAELANFDNFMPADEKTRDFVTMIFEKRT